MKSYDIDVPDSALRTTTTLFNPEPAAKTSEACKDKLSDFELSDEYIDAQHFSDDDDDLILHDKTTTPDAAVRAPYALYT